ncbi:MAG: TIGR02710 family CRISPR-associated CARF protein [Nitrospira sp.]|nr:TIGR02710 family CRISPR-associated CARF protein [Nitrospira sp.]
MTARALLISIGGSPETAIYSINELKPDCLCFFASEETRPVVNDVILPQLKDRPAWMAEIITEDANDLLTCYRAITDKWTELQKNWRLEPGDWVVDYTGGTKPMVAAIVLATIDYSSGYRYISRADRTKEGAGIVIDGTEQILHHLNPWDELAVKERHEAAVLFARGRYAQAADIFRGLTQRVSGGEKQLYKVLGEIAEGYGLWDNFQHKQAWEKLKPSHKSLEMATLFGGPQGLKALFARLKENLTLLEKLAIGIPGIRKEHFLDLMSNARRRASLENKYDDALARLYRATEAYGQISLASHGIDSSDVKKEQIPSDVRDEFVQKYTDVIDNRIKLPLFAAYTLLQKTGDNAGKVFFDNLPQIKLLLDSRNKSILAHGFEPVKRERYEELYKLLLKISNLQEDSIPKFPDITL